MLVHCKMGVSRSASVVIAYAMKAYNWDFQKALQHVKDKRSCIKPNTSFLSQLETYQGILDAMKNKEKLQRSKSETNLKSPDNNPKKALQERTGDCSGVANENSLQTTMSGQDLRQLGARPKSWSPDNVVEMGLTPEPKSPPVFLSLENLNNSNSVSKESLTLFQQKSASVREHVLMPCDNGESYSVSPNRIVHLPGNNENNVSTVKDRVNVLEKKVDKKKLVLNLTTQFESGKDVEEESRSSPPMLRAVLMKKEIWDPGEKDKDGSVNVEEANICDNKSSETKVVTSCDPFSNQLDRVFDKEERKQRRDGGRECPSRQSSWSSYDSAVVLGENRDAPSRHSSWGSGDTRTLPSRNSSWGSYDMKPGAPIHYLNEKGEKVTQTDALEHSSSGIFQYDKEDVPWYVGTVKRTKQKLEEGGVKDLHAECPVQILTQNEDMVEAFNTALIECKKPENVAIPTKSLSVKDDSGSTRLSVSAPEPSSMELIPQECSLSRSASNVSKDLSAVISTPQCASVKQHKIYLENLSKDVAFSTKKDSDETATPGKVQNLKMEFERKTTEQKSAPTSPVTIHQPKQQEVVAALSPCQEEELNFKKLIGKFETQPSSQVTLRAKPFAQNKNFRHSCFEVSSPKRGAVPLNDEGGYRRPPLAPGLGRAVVATVVAKAVKKQQQFGKSHPLARLSIKRHNSAVYNTM